MVILSEYSESQIKNLIDKYNGFRTPHEYGISAFWYWYYQVMNYASGLDSTCEQDGKYLVYQMRHWGNIIYSCCFVENECMIYIHEFKFNKRNFNAWLHHKPLKESLISQIVKEVLQVHIKHEKMKKKVIKLNEEGLTKIVEKSVKQLLERRELLDEMARVGYMGEKKEFEIYVRTDDPGRIPHFHVRDSSTQGKEFEACVELKTNRYFSHGKYNDKLNTSQRKQLAQFM